MKKKSEVKNFNMTYLLYGSTIPWKGIGKEFWRNQIGLGPLGFLANPQLLTDLVCLYQPPFELD